MRLIAKNAESEFTNELQLPLKRNDFERILHLKFSLLAADKEEWQPTVLEIIENNFHDEIDAVYCFDDGDLFLAARALTQRQTDFFIEYLSAFIMPAPARELAHLYELRIHKNILQTEVQRKIEALAKVKTVELKSAEKSDAEVLDHSNLLQKIDKRLIESLKARRQSRMTPEVLIAEDDLFSCSLISSSLKRYNPVVKNDGWGAVLGYVNRAPDVLFLDIDLPDISGHEVLDQILDIDPEAYVIMLSGHKDRENVVKAMALGAKGFIAKPFTRQKLYEYLEKSPFIQAKSKEHA